MQVVPIEQEPVEALLLFHRAVYCTSRVVHLQSWAPGMCHAGDFRRFIMFPTVLIPQGCEFLDINMESLQWVQKHCSFCISNGISRPDLWCLSMWATRRAFRRCSFIWRGHRSIIYWQTRAKGQCLQVLVMVSIFLWTISTGHVTMTSIPVKVRICTLSVQAYGTAWNNLASWIFLHILPWINP